MDFSKLALFSMMKTKMAYLTERQDVLAQNIANVDTPGYKAKDLKKLDFHNMAMLEAGRLEMRATTETHQAPKRKKQDFRLDKVRNTYETTPTENNIEVEEQMMKVAETKLDYEQTTNLYKKMATMFKTAIGNQ